MERPERCEPFNQYMASRRQKQATWIQVYPVREDATGLAPDRPLFVDVGGGIGHQATEFAREYEDLPGTIHNQDLPHAIGNALKTAKVEHQVHDMFSSEQPIKSIICTVSHMHHQR